MKFKACKDERLGIYPVVDRSDKLEVLYRSGVTTAQLRIKNLEGEALEAEVINAIKISQAYDAQFFLNDYWEMAIKYGAYGVHLGQEDIQEADLDAIHAAGIRLGISTHTTDEINIALDIQPSYLAIGPIYHTDSKKMVYTPVGLDDLGKWSNNIDYPIVAIGGINLDNIEDVLARKKVNGISMISGVLDEKGEVSEAKTKALVAIYDRVFNG